MEGTWERIATIAFTQCAIHRGTNALRGACMPCVTFLTSSFTLPLFHGRFTGPPAWLRHYRARCLTYTVSSVDVLWVLSLCVHSNANTTAHLADSTQYSLWLCVTSTGHVQLIIPSPTSITKVRTKPDWVALIRTGMLLTGMKVVTANSLTEYKI